MPLTVLISRENVEDRLRSYGLAAGERALLYAALRDTLSAYYHEASTAPGARIAPESYMFWMTLTAPYGPSDPRAFRFLVNDEEAPNGVLRVIWVDEV